MKFFYIHIFLIFSLSISSETNSQSDWFIQNTGNNVDLSFVFFVDANTGWALGWNPYQSFGIIYRTMNGGMNWDTLYFGQAVHINSLFFINQNTGWISTLETWVKEIRKTTDSGNTWSTQYSSPINRFYSMYFLDANTGWAVGEDNNYNGIVYKTTNGGINWISSIMLPIRNLGKVQFINQNTGWTAGGYNSQSGRGLARTTNGGGNWEMLQSSNVFFNFYFVNVYTGWCLIDSVYGKYLIKKTTNGGVNWITQYTTLQYEYFSSIQFVNPDTGWAVGGDMTQNLRRSRIIATRNGGQNWIHQWAPYNQFSGNLISVFFVNQNTGWSVGGNITILKTTNGGGEGGTAVERQNSSVPEEYLLYQNYPNPFNPLTFIEFDVPKSSFVKLYVYDVLGREISVFVNKYLKEGSYKTEWNASAYPSGVYFYKLITDGFTETRKMVLIK